MPAAVSFLPQIGVPVCSANLNAAHLQAPAQPDPEPPDDGRSARKRRRTVRITPTRPSQQHQDQQQQEDAGRQLQPPGPGLQAVVAAVARLAADLQERCRLQQPGIECATAFASLLGLLAPLAPRETLRMAMTVLPAALQPAPGGRRQSPGSEGDRLLAQLRLVLATLQTGLAEAAASAVPASVALERVPPASLLAALQRCWPAEDGTAAGAAGELGATPECKALALGAGLAALQAELVDSSDLLELLQQALEDSSRGGGSSGITAAAAAAALLLPAACCIGGSKEHLLGSQARGTQGGRRHKPQPNPLVAALQQLLGNAAQQQEAAQQQPQRQAVLAAVAGGLLCVLNHAHEPLRLTQAAIDAACAGTGAGSSSSPHSIGQLLQRGEAAEPADFHPTLTVSVSEWVRLALEQLVAAALPAEGQVRLFMELLPVLPALLVFPARLMSSLSHCGVGPFHEQAPDAVACCCHLLACRRCLWMPSLPSCSAPPRASWSTAGRWLSG
jgi:hypothetical protein